ncbi:MAG: hypothetical protein JNG89_07165 [Planctomycetaceae bacterium]|nr:hypothetical protein [Planctomycetaceae bacterium]
MNTRRSIWRISKGEYFVIALVCAVLCFLLYPAIEWRLRNGPPGEVIPTVPPNEARRLVHPSGLSIVRPKNWEKNHHWSAHDPTLRIWPRRYPPGGRMPSVITVQKWPAPEPPDVTGFTPLQFQSYPACERMQVYRNNNSTKNSLYEMYVDRNGEWWMISFGLAGEQMTELPPEIRQYIDTVRLP